MDPVLNYITNKVYSIQYFLSVYLINWNLLSSLKLQKNFRSWKGSHGMPPKDDDFRSYQARQGLQYVQEKPKFIQDFMTKTGITASGTKERPRIEKERPDFDDEVPVMVDSEGNMLHDEDFESAIKETDLGNDQGGEEAYILAALEEFKDQTIDPSEIVQEPTQKRSKKSGIEVRDRPKISTTDKRLLSFAFDEEEDA